MIKFDITNGFYWDRGVTPQETKEIKAIETKLQIVLEEQQDVEPCIFSESSEIPQTLSNLCEQETTYFMKSIKKLK